ERSTCRTGLALARGVARERVVVGLAPEERTHQQHPVGDRNGEIVCSDQLPARFGPQSQMLVDNTRLDPFPASREDAPVWEARRPDLSVVILHEVSVRRVPDRAPRGSGPTRVTRTAGQSARAARARSRRTHATD